MRFLLQSFEADRLAGQPFEFCMRHSRDFSFCQGAVCLRKNIAEFFDRGSARPGAALFLLMALLGICRGLEAQQTEGRQTGDEQAWTVVGPAGGDARAFAAVPGDPSHLYLGSTNSWLYESVNGGASWRRLVKLDGSDALVLDHIVVDAADLATIFVAGWRDEGGGLWVSHDQGKNWSEVESLKGQSIRSFTQAPSDAKVLLAGTLEGIYRSEDSGVTWNEISPPGSREIHEVESLAVDPGDVNVIYAGTWHLPWKTDDGGKTWNNIKQGIIDDSDVFSIILDPVKPKTVFLSACSGIYKSESAGARFRKIEGIPSTARRTRVLKQDPANREIVYAGTTEGLYKTLDSGKTFKLLTDDDVIVNDVFVDPRDSNHVLLATDRGGVMTSTDGGATFSLSNEGFSERKVSALLVDRGNAAHLFAGVVNDKKFGGVFVSEDGGGGWKQIAAGLDGRDVYALSQTKDGMVVAGTSQGIFALDPPAAPDAAQPAGETAGGPSAALSWEPRNVIANTEIKVSVETHYKTKVNVEKEVQAPVIELESRVNALDVSGDVWLASTSLGLLTSRDQGASWQGGPVMGAGDYLSVAVHGDLMVAVRSDAAVLSKDEGKSWWPIGLPKMLTRIHRAVFAPDGTIWLGAREGVYFSRDQGKTWMWIGRLPFRDIVDLEFDAGSQRVLVSSRSSDQVFGIDPKTMTWKLWRTGYRTALIRAAGDRLVAATMDDGVVVQQGIGNRE
jgi:photosystem II stability/assembly factor-like uncharacterized protein